MPKRLIKRDRTNGREEVLDHWFANLMDEPALGMSGFEYFELLTSDVAAFGNHYSLKVYNNRGEVEQLIPIEPWRITVSQLEDRSLAYNYLSPDGETGRWSDDQILHVRGMSRDGIVGECPLSLLAGTVGLARVIQTYSNRFWQQSARPSLMLEAAAPIPKEALIQLKQSFEEYHSGAQNAGRVAVLPHNLTARPIPNASADSEQLIETRTFLIQEVCRAMRVPPSLIGENSRSTYSNAEQASLDFVQTTLAPWCRRIEGAFQRSILNGIGSDHELHIDVRGMLRGDIASRASWYQSLWGIGAISTNEIRRLEDLPPVEFGDEMMIPANNVRPLRSFGEGTPEEQDGQDATLEPAEVVNGEPVEKLQDTALNGAQVASLLQIVESASTGILTPESTIALIMASFPTISRDEAAKIVAGIQSREPVEVEPPVVVEEPVEEPEEEKAERARDSRGRFVKAGE
jgi:HK97 family phage portal protein